MADTVLLIHGLGRTSLSMLPMAWGLQRQGFETHVLDYRSRRQSIHFLVEHALAPRVDALSRRGTVHFVTHSLGGVLVRALAAERYDADAPLDGSRAVMLAPPHAGSEVADLLRQRQPFKRVLGPTLQELGTDADSTPLALGPVRGIDAGVIAGDLRQPPFRRAFDGAHDGLVSVASAHAPDGLADRLVVRAGHTFPMASPEVIRQTTHFLRHGCFDHGEDPAP